MNISSNSINRIPAGLGRWLIIIGISVLVSLANSLINLFCGFSYEFDSNSDEIDLFTRELLKFSSPHYGDYLYGLQYIVLFNYLTFALLNSYLIWLYFKKNYRFPKFFIAVEIYRALFSFISFFIITLLTENIVAYLIFTWSALLQLIPVFIHAGITIPYMYSSKRVKNTFVKN